jgi:hypothetical protein
LTAVAANAIAIASASTLLQHEPHGIVDGGNVVRIEGVP